MENCSLLTLEVFFKSNKTFSPQAKFELQDIMVNSCCAVGCRSGYNDQDAPGNVTLHRFPKDPQNFQAWIRAISRKDGTPSERSKLCIILIGTCK